MYRKLRNDELERLSAEEFKRAHKLKITVILDNVRSQHNIGSVFRTADSFFIERIILCGICAVPPTPEIHKSALGAEFSVDWQYYKNTSEAVAALKEEGYIIISVEQAENSIMLHNFEPDPDKKYALVFGNEVKGVSQDVVDMSDSVLEIPQFGTKHSLNISVSAGAVLWECCKKLKLV
ncbi:MAG: RNA methyltransferase [Bacteroidales bacterium]|nr:RNA methyltransferase [Bacteroidales bacterium]MBQ3522201.1 RNA methyltransferase [Bacteroidales bacterium]MBQ7998646.1 RNA methyltransferase [Bacteroidales bacterium]MBQ8033593.1 RNA methyltransferase [Bacteroidales bacterium]MBR4094067.1 RNA methyltransferase [Bacteroidales bacterium]